MRSPGSYNGPVEAATVEARLRSFFEADARGAIAVYLFGSVARRETRTDSDVDLGISFSVEPPATLAAPQLADAIRLRL